MVGFFLHSLRVSVEKNGWKAMRTWWFVCFAIGSGIWVILYLDPRGLLGIYPMPLIKFTEWTAVVWILLSLAFTGYVYLDVLHRQSMTQTPPILRTAWISINVFFAIFHLLLAAIAAGMRSNFIFGVAGFGLTVHGVMSIALCNVFLWKLERVLLKQTAAMGDLGNVSTFNRALKKIRLVRFGSLLLGNGGFAYQAYLSVDRVRAWTTLVPYDNSTFGVGYLVAPIVCLGLYSFLFYISQSTRSQDENSQPKGTLSERSKSSANRSSANTRSSGVAPPTPSSAGMQQLV